MAAQATWWWKTSRSVAWPSTAWTMTASKPKTPPHLLLGHRLPGQTGPYAERAGYDLMIQAPERPDEHYRPRRRRTRRRPTAVGVAVIDVFTGVYACSAILAALEARHRTGQGQHIDMALLDVGMAIPGQPGCGVSEHRHGARAPGQQPPQPGALSGLSHARWGHAAGHWQRRRFARFCQAAAQPQWASDARFATNALRVGHRSELVPLIEAVTRQRTTAQWIALLEDKAVPCGPINTLDQAFADAQVQHRALVVRQPTQQAAPAGLGQMRHQPRKCWTCSYR